MGFSDYNALSKTPKAFNELRAVGFEVEQKNGQYFVKIDGISIQVYEYDTVWTVKARREAIVDDKSKEKDLKDKLNDLKAEFKLCLKNFDECLDNMKLARVSFSRYLTNNNAHTLSDLKGTGAYAQGVVLQDKKYQTSADENAALSAVLQKNNQIQGVCSDMMYLA